MLPGECKRPIDGENITLRAGDTVLIPALKEHLGVTRWCWSVCSCCGASRSDSRRSTTWAVVPGGRLSSRDACVDLGGPCEPAKLQLPQVGRRTMWRAWAQHTIVQLDSQ